jgi:hypothetical protein
MAETELFQHRVEKRMVLKAQGSLLKIDGTGKQRCHGGMRDLKRALW